MTTIRLSHERAESAVRSSSILQSLLLIAGILSAAVYIGTDLLAASRYPGYSIADQAISELSAIGAPTKDLWTSMMPAFGIFLLAFSIGVIRMSSRNRALRITGALLLLLGLSGVLWWFFPMHQRGTEMTWTDVGHIVMSAASVLLILLFIGFGAFALGPLFRAYSLATLATFVATAAVTFSWAGRIANGQPTPWLGAVERVMIYAYLIWIAALAVALMRRRDPLAAV
jgi:hypothetical membrane protein